MIVWDRLIRCVLYTLYYQHCNLQEYITNINGDKKYNHKYKDEVGSVIYCLDG